MVTTKEIKNTDGTKYVAVYINGVEIVPSKTSETK
jgi:hypothetical protein